MVLIGEVLKQASLFFCLRIRLILIPKIIA